MIWSGRYRQGARAARAPEWFRPILIALVAAGIIITIDGGSFLISHSLLVLPHEYDRLSAYGVPVSARVVGCHMARGKVCDLTYAYGGTLRTVVYGQDGDQFAAVGSTVTLLVDPSDPSVAFTDKDVQTGYRDTSELPLGLLLLATSASMVAALAFTVIRRASGVDGNSRGPERGSWD